MMKYFLFLILILPVITSLGCEKKEDRVDRRIAISLDLENANYLSLSDIAENIEYVELEASSTHLITEISLIKMYDQYIFVLENIFPERRLSIFTRDGRAVAVIENTGEGPGKYFKVDDFWFNESAGTIELLDGIQSKIVVYKLDGTHDRDISLSANFEEFVKYGDNDYVFYAGSNPIDNQYNSIHFYKDNRIVSSKLRFPDKYASINVSARNLSNTADNDYYLFYRPFDNTVYEFGRDSNSLIKKYTIDLGNRFVDDEWLNKMVTLPPPGQMQMVNNSGKIYRFDRVEYLPNYLLVSMIDHSERKMYYSFIDKNTYEVIAYHTIPTVDRINTFDLGPTPYQFHGAGELGTLIFTIDAFDLHQYLTTTSIANPTANPVLVERHAKLKTRFSSIDVQRSNPILMLIHTKERI